MQLHGKFALVTGAAHRVGKAIAVALAAQGVHVAVHYGRSEDAARETLAELQALGVRAFTVSADLRDPEQIAALFARVKAEFGRLDILVNSAANFVKRPFLDTTVEDWKNVMQANLRAPFLCTQHAARLMRQTDRPADQPAAIINIADSLGMHHYEGYAVHGLSKSGVIHLTRYTAVELAPEIRVNSVAPGPVMPPVTMDPDGPVWRGIGARLPLKRTGDPAMVGQAVVFLAGADYVTGALLPVDGGEHLCGGR